MKITSWILGLLGLVLIIDAALAIGLGDKYISMIGDYVPIDYVVFASDLARSSSETFLVMRLGEAFLGIISIMIAQSMD